MIVLVYMLIDDGLYAQLCIYTVTYVWITPLVIKIMWFAPSDSYKLFLQSSRESGSIRHMCSSHYV